MKNNSNILNKLLILPVPCPCHRTPPTAPPPTTLQGPSIPPTSATETQGPSSFLLFSPHVYSSSTPFPSEQVDPFQSSAVFIPFSICSRRLLTNCASFVCEFVSFVDGEDGRLFFIPDSQMLSASHRESWGWQLTRVVSLGPFSCCLSGYSRDPVDVPNLS